MRSLPPQSVSLIDARREREGFTLLEVILATAIFLGALIVLGDMLATGGRAAVQSQLETEAILRCESKLADVVAGAEPMNSASGVAFPDDAKWTWSLDVAPGPLEGLLELSVVATRAGQTPTSNVSFSLKRLIRDPQMFLDALLEESSASASGGGGR